VRRVALLLALTGCSVPFDLEIDAGPVPQGAEVRANGAILSNGTLMKHYDSYDDAQSDVYTLQVFANDAAIDTVSIMVSVCRDTCVAQGSCILAGELRSETFTAGVMSTGAFFPYSMTCTDGNDIFSLAP
jgi:hypothetical protein